MRAPHIVILGFDDWLAKQLRPLAAEQHWLLHDLRQSGAVRELLKDHRPAVLLLQVDPHAETSPGLSLLAELHAARPDISIAIVSDGKLSEGDRARWTGATFDLGAAFVL